METDGILTKRSRENPLLLSVVAASYIAIGISESTGRAPRVRDKKNEGLNAERGFLIALARVARLRISHSSHSTQRRMRDLRERPAVHRIIVLSNYREARK